MQSENIVYIIDPDEALRRTLTALLREFEIRVCTFSDAESFFATCSSANISRSCLLVAANLPGLSGMSLLRQLRRQGFSQPVIVLTDTANRDLQQQALNLGATEVIEKPLVNAFLIETLSELLPGRPEVPDPTRGGITLHDGTTVTFRIMRPDDAAIMQAFVQGLSDRSRYLRFFSGIRQLSPYMLEQLTRPDYPNSYAVIATVCKAGREQQVGVARYAPTEAGGVAEFAVAVADDWQGTGIASRLLRGVTAAAVVAGIDRLEAVVLRQNHRMLKLATDLGFATFPGEGDATVVGVGKDLRNPVRVSGLPPIVKEMGVQFSRRSLG